MKKQYLMVNKLKKMTPAQVVRAHNTLLNAEPALELIREYVAQEIDLLNGKLLNVESLYKQHGDCHTRVATILAKREQLIKLHDKLSPVEVK
jgi:hypothetical protein